MCNDQTTKNSSYNRGDRMMNLTEQTNNKGDKKWI